VPGINTGIKDPSRLVWTEVIGVLYRYEPGRDLRQYQVYTSLIPNSIPDLYLPHPRQKSVFEPIPEPRLVWKFQKGPDNPGMKVLSNTQPRGKNVLALSLWSDCVEDLTWEFEWWYGLLQALIRSSPCQVQPLHISHTVQNEFTLATSQNSLKDTAERKMEETSSLPLLE
jgi:hypothetical protein